MEPKIQDFFDSLPPKKRKLALRVREVILKSSSFLQEDIKWGNLTFVSSGNIAFVYTYESSDYINLGFIKGTEPA